MPKRLTASRLGEQGKIDGKLIGRRVNIEVAILFTGKEECEITIGGQVIKGVLNDRLRRAAIEATMDESHAPMAWLRDLDGTGSLHVCAAADPGAIPVYGDPS